MDEVSPVVDGNDAATTTPLTPTVVWFRDDLRVSDNPALSAAAERGGPVVAVYILDEVSTGIRPLGAASRWWLHHSLESLADDLTRLGIPLTLRRGRAPDLVKELVAEVGAGAVVWNRRYGGAEIRLDGDLMRELREQGCDVHSFAASLLFEPWTISTGQGTPYSVFTPFWRSCREGLDPRAPLPTPIGVTARIDEPWSDDLVQWSLLPSRPDWAHGLRDRWRVGESAAAERLDEFLSDDIDGYTVGRDRPALMATSGLSPHLRWGELSPHQVWHAVSQHRGALSAAGREAVTRFLTELGWREFSWHVLFHFPLLAENNWRPEFDVFPWPPLDPRALRAWQRGQTGIPLVDAGMRELWNSGTMHNRVRMVVASFLTKNLLIDWREGERWFWDTLVDADAASNPFNWQWVAGSGADAAPYFRVFNPLLQASKFDPEFDYIRRHVPEWGTDAYPQPIVDLAETRAAALAAYDIVKARKSERPASRKGPDHDQTAGH